MIPGKICKMSRKWFHTDRRFMAAMMMARRTWLEVIMREEELRAGTILWKSGHISCRSVHHFVEEWEPLL